MVKNFIFIEDGSVDVENMRTILDNSGNTGVKFITYKQGANKPELVSIESSEFTQNPEVYKQEARETMLTYLYDFLLEHTERLSYVEPDHATIMSNIRYKTTYHGTMDELIDNFKRYIENKEG